MNTPATETPEATITIDATGGQVVLAIKQGDTSAVLAMDVAKAQEFAAAVAARARDAYVQSLELQLAAARQELTALRERVQEGKGSP